ncbi:MAG: hypothetical protein DIU78_015770 [Pseudomonadota bacterium]|nr:MAG: hypothetical protein DIU78_21660 [Pseudomonadota bacterium]
MPAATDGAATSDAALQTPFFEFDADRIREAIASTAGEPPDGRSRLGLRLAVVPTEPGQPWLVGVFHRGTHPVRVTFDLRLLELEIRPPATSGQKAPKPVTCTLPGGIRPDTPEPELQIELQPGEGLIDLVDPRLYCFGKRESPLVPGAEVVATLGWPEKTKTVWRKGKAETVAVEQQPPFVARRVTTIPEPDAVPAEPVARSESAPASDAEAVKKLVASTVTLGPAFAPPKAPDTGAPFELVLVEGSDAPTPRDARVTVALINRSSEPQYVFFRRELLNFEVSAPHGFFTCRPGPDRRAPERQSFVRVAPGERITATSRLVELCPEAALGVPGLYLIHARLHAAHSGFEFGLDAFTGRLVSREPALVRIHEGWSAFPGQHAPERIRMDDF